MKKYLPIAANIVLALALGALIVSGQQFRFGNDRGYGIPDFSPAPSAAYDPANDKPPLTDDEFYSATSTRLGITMKLQKAATEYYMGSSEPIRKLIMTDDGVSGYVDVWSGNMVPDPNSFAPVEERKLVPDRKLRIYVFKAENYAELEKKALALAKEAGPASDCVMEKNEDSYLSDYVFVDKQKPTSIGQDGTPFKTPCLPFNFPLFHWDQKLGKAYLAWLGSDAPYFDSLRRDRYMTDSIRLFK